MGGSTLMKKSYKIACLGFILLAIVGILVFVASKGGYSTKKPSETAQVSYPVHGEANVIYKKQVVLTT